MIDALLTLLQNDAALTAALPGGVHRAKEISRKETPAAFDNKKELLPCVLVKGETATPWGPHHDSGRLYIVLYFYQRSGYTNIEAARKRVYALLHRQKLTPTDGSGCYDIVHANDLLDVEDTALQAPMAVSRYVVTVQRG
jgi:hypothetical protein